MTRINIFNKPERIPKGQQKRTIQRNWKHRVHKMKRQTKQKTTQYYAQTNTNNVNKTCVPVQTTGELRRTSFFMHKYNTCLIRR